MKLKNRYKLFLILLFHAVFFQSCSVKKHIPEGELLYTGGQVVIQNESEVEKSEAIRKKAQEVVMPNPNSKFLGMRPGLYFYYKMQQENPGFINKFFYKQFGEEPVYASSVRTDEVEDIILNRLENNGFFYSHISTEMHEYEETKTAEAVYNIELAEPYVLANKMYEIEKDSLQLYEEIEAIMTETLIEPGMRFDLEALKLERERINNFLKGKGYYNFDPRFLIFEADTNQYNNKKFDLYLRLKEDIPREAVIPYYIARVNVYPNYNADVDTLLLDTIKYKEKYFIQPEIYFEPEKLEPYILIDEGDYYSPVESKFTSRRLASIGTYKFVNIRYDEIDSLSTDTLGVLEANIFLSPLTKRSVRAELQAVSKSNNFMGPKLSLSYSNRNLFESGEILNLTGQFGYEWQSASGSGRGLSSILLGVAGDLVFPRMLFPININNNNWFKYSIPKTKVSLGLNYLSRTQLYQMYSVTARFGYTWRSNRFITHELDPISIDYSKLRNVTPEFQEILDNNQYLRQSFEQQFIAGLIYSFTYNGMVDEYAIHKFYLNANLDVAGNTIDLLSKGNNEEPNRVFGVEYAQYLKIDGDFRYHYKLGSGQTLASRLFAGYGMPYGNSEVMPFSRQYFAGGPYSVRAFRIRSLGPGTFNPEEGDGAYFDQAGNIRLEANLEYRFPIFSFFKGATFIDVGNVWHTGNVGYLPDEVGKFSGDFLNELGVGAGVGLRIDIQSFIIRFDLAAPMRKPWLREGERWVFDFGSPVLNFGIGYPF